MPRVSSTEAPIESHDFTLPNDLTLWRRKFTPKERIKLINPEGFPKDAILDGLGLRNNPLTPSFGICVPEEIAHRQSLMRILIEDRELARFIGERSNSFSLPDDEQHFTEYFRTDYNHNPFWAWVHDLLSILKQVQNPPARLQLFESGLRDCLGHEESEIKMASWILDRVNSIAVIEGIAEVDVNYSCPTEEEKKQGKKEGYEGKIADIEVLGHQMFSSAIVESPRMTDYPCWARKDFHWLKLFGLHLLARKWIHIQHRIKRRKAFQEMVISEASKAVKRDVLNALINKLNSCLKSSPILPPLNFHVAFTYSKEGLKLRIFGIDPLDIDVQESFGWASFSGYDDRQREIIEEARENFAETISEMYTTRKRSEIISDFKRRAGEAIDTWFDAPSPNIDCEHRWYMLSTLYNSSVCIDTYKKAQKIRNFAAIHFNTLRDVLKVANIVSDKAEELNTPLCFGKIAADNENVVSFGEIFPIHLLSSMNGHDPVPIRGLSRSSEQIICLTGANDGGKTVAGESILDNIWIFQSGLPIFGRDFTLNVSRLY